MASIPEYPEYSRVDETVQDQINEYTGNHLPYSDFNFANVYCWDIANSAKVSMLNQNLVLRLPDYMDGTEFFSFLGRNEAEATASELLDEAERNTPQRELRLVPEICAIALEHSSLFKIEEDPDGHDYVLSLSAVVEKLGRRFRSMRREISSFESKHALNSTFLELDITDELVQSKITKVFLGREKLKTGNDYASELVAIGRLFAYGNWQQLASYGLEIEGELKAFIICEKISDEWCVGHFWKADTNYRGIYRYLMYRLAERLSEEGFSHLNIEQDLGIKGMKQMKQSFCPVARLKKYTISD